MCSRIRRFDTDSAPVLWHAPLLPSRFVTAGVLAGATTRLLALRGATHARRATTPLQDSLSGRGARHRSPAHRCAHSPGFWWLCARACCCTCTARTVRTATVRPTDPTPHQHDGRGVCLIGVPAMLIHGAPCWLLHLRFDADRPGAPEQIGASKRQQQQQHSVSSGQACVGRK